MKSEQASHAHEASLKKLAEQPVPCQPEGVVEGPLPELRRRCLTTPVGLGLPPLIESWLLEAFEQARQRSENGDGEPLMHFFSCWLALARRRPPALGWLPVAFWCAWFDVRVAPALVCLGQEFCGNEAWILTETDGQKGRLDG